MPGGSHGCWSVSSRGRGSWEGTGSPRASLQAHSTSALSQATLVPDRARHRQLWDLPGLCLYHLQVRASSSTRHLPGVAWQGRCSGHPELRGAAGSHPVQFQAVPGVMWCWHSCNFSSPVPPGAGAICLSRKHPQHLRTDTNPAVWGHQRHPPPSQVLSLTEAGSFRETVSEQVGSGCPQAMCAKLCPCASSCSSMSQGTCVAPQHLTASSYVLKGHSRVLAILGLTPGPFSPWGAALAPQEVAGWVL